MSASTAGWVRAQAPAKVNPYLAVLGRRADGYHELDTTLATLALFDTVAVRARDVDGIAFTVAGPCASADVPVDATNLAVRAARAALDAARSAGANVAGLELALEKRIPSQAGLGGGSSDAAAAWLATASLLGLDPTSSAARRTLAELGSDCAFFLEARETGFARCRGRGERVATLPRPRREWWAVVATPAQGASTAAVYGALARSGSHAPPQPELRLDALDRAEADARASLFNRLEGAALGAVAELRTWRELLDELGLAHFRLAGSGASFFGLYDSHPHAESDSARLAERLARRALTSRGNWIVPFAGHGVRLLP
ncbi:MAG: 4-(cytidine 5'-diphospho)-2-C-methyl-D-erythritol kinase [Planctomycetes bacterium]|nr:4-(cytidine 5'-diphospho)-2-C-methyl-D-erythritol kinase [Planctomycetota bacterium]